MNEAFCGDAPRVCPQQSGEGGFTLLELVVTCLIVAILAVMATSVFNMIQQNRMISGTGEVVSALGLARNEAILRQTRVALCAREGDLAQGWQIVAGNPDCQGSGGALTGTVLFVRTEPLRLSLCTTQCSVSTPQKFVFGPMGNLEGGTATAILCADSMAEGRQIKVNAAGLVKTRTFACS
ncbi:MAG: GspH/FimT family pseudopilin [Zoogloeaceae bacterium]|nr:GspH/FimT family pseudopilin [Zoogloeaceae bacterium]